MSNAIVVLINKSRGMFMAELSDGSFSVVETDDIHDLEIGNSITGALEAEGSCILRNVSSYASFEATVQNAGCTRENATKRTMLR